MRKIFISYNPSIQQEQSLALRLQTLSSLYGLNVSLPDRVGSKTVKDSTKERIAAAELFIVFSTISLSKMVRDEIMFARTQHKKVVVVYDKDVPRNMKVSGVKEIEFDRRKDSPDRVLLDILKETGQNALSKLTPKKGAKSSKKPAKSDDSFAGFVLVGLGLLLLAAFISDEKK